MHGYTSLFIHSFFDGHSKNGHKETLRSGGYIHYLHFGDFFMGVYSSDVPFKSLYIDYTSQKRLKRLSGFVISD